MNKAVLFSPNGRPPQTESAATEPRSSGGRPRCLVLAESSSLRILVRLILSMEGWDVAEQEEASLPSYQAVIADLDCFVWQGDYVRQVVRRATANGLPVLALTGQELTFQERALLGHPPLMMKPFELAAFVQVLYSWRQADPRAAQPA